MMATPAGDFVSSSNESTVDARLRDMLLIFSSPNTQHGDELAMEMASYFNAAWKAFEKKGSGAFGITAADIKDWVNHPGLAELMSQDGDAQGGETDLTDAEMIDAGASF